MTAAAAAVWRVWQVRPDSQRLRSRRRTLVGTATTPEGLRALIAGVPGRIDVERVGGAR